MYSPFGGRPFDAADAAGLLSAARARARPMQRFDEYYRAYPMVMAPGPDRPHLNYGSKVILPPSALDKVSKLHVQWPLLMEMTNGEKGCHTHCGVLEFVSEEGRAYIPQWMMETLRLDVGDMIQFRSTSLELARMVRLQPQSVNFLDITDPRAVLEKAFRNFATLTKGDVFVFEYNDEVYSVAVLEVKPETEKMGVSMIETDVSVDFAPPVGYVEPERKPKGSGTSTPRTNSNGLPAGGVVHHQGTMAAAINYDSIAPGSASAKPTNFVGAGQKLVIKASRTATPKLPSSSSSTAQSPLPSTSEPVTSGDETTTAAPKPLRISPNKLFLGFPIVPVRTQEDKEREAEDSRKPHFAGQGQSLRGAKKAEGDKPSESPRPNGQKS